MIETLDEYVLSLPVNIWDKMLYENIKEFQLDIYYNDKGFPANIHDLYGIKAVNEFRIALINEICKKNNTNDIWRVSSDSFAVISKKTNCGNFEMEFKGKVLKILKKTILIYSVLETQYPSNN